MSLRGLFSVAASNAAALLLSVAACSSSSSPSSPQDTTDASMDAAADAQSCPPPPATGDLPCDVSAVFQMRCQHCHTTPKLPPPNNAPFTLRTYEDLTARFGITDLRRWQRVSQVIEPNNYPHMPPPDQPQLTDSDFTTLRTWFAQCAPAVPEGTGCDVSEGTAGDASSDGPAADAQSADDASSDAQEAAASDSPSGG